MKLKFRAWHKKEQKYYKVLIISLIQSYVFIESISGDSGWWVKFDEVILEQYTGVKDIEDTELYINDIVKVDYDLMSKNDTGLRVIRFMEGALRLLEYDYFEDDNVAKWTDWQVLHQGVIKEDKIVKVGNIHENKELLK